MLVEWFYSLKPPLAKGRWPGGAGSEGWRRFCGNNRQDRRENGLSRKHIPSSMQRDFVPLHSHPSVSFADSSPWQGEPRGERSPGTFPPLFQKSGAPSGEDANGRASALSDNGLQLVKFYPQEGLAPPPSGWYTVGEHTGCCPADRRRFG